MTPTATAAALALALRAGQGPEPGARPCLNEVALDAILETLSPYAITTRTTRGHPVPLYRKAMGTAFEQVPGAIRALHDRTTDHAAQGLSVITIGDNPVARALSSLSLLPKPGAEVPTTVTFTIRDGRERWHRQFGAFAGGSVLGWPEHGVVWEQFGLLKGRADLVVRDDGLDIVIWGFSLYGLPLPRAIWLRSWGRERVDDEGRFTFDVGIGLTFGIDLMTYRGWLAPDP